MADFVFGSFGPALDKREQRRRAAFAAQVPYDASADPKPVFGSMAPTPMRLAGAIKPKFGAGISTSEMSSIADGIAGGHLPPIRQSELRPYEPTVFEGLADWIGEKLGGGDRFATQDYTDALSIPLQTLNPLDAAELSGRALADGSYGEAGVDALSAGFLPAAKFLRTPMREGAKLLSGFDNLAPSLERRAAGSLASRSAAIYDPPAKPLRSFTEDYPNAAPVDGSGNLTHDVDGKPLVARFVAGRQVAGGADTAIPPEALDEIAERLTGQAVAAVPKSALPRGAVGSYRVARGIDGPERSIQVLESLAPSSAYRVKAHEIGHAVSDMAAGIEVPPMQAKTVYNDLNNPDLAQARNRSADRGLSPPDPASRSVYRNYSPLNSGYGSVDVGDELTAESVRAYMADPNYMKTVAPKVAAAIRKAVNGNPRLRDVIQFNSLAVPLLGSMAPSVLARGGEAR